MIKYECAGPRWNLEGCPGYSPPSGGPNYHTDEISCGAFISKTRRTDDKCSPHSCPVSDGGISIRVANPEAGPVGNTLYTTDYVYRCSTAQY